MDKQQYNIYFSGSISGGRQDAETYREIIAHLKKYGRVLTDHIGSPDLTAGGEEEVDDEQVYLRDMQWIDLADVFIAEVSNPSLGVGYELASAEQRRKPVLCLFREGATRRLSAMIAGNPALTVRRYRSTGEIIPILDAFFTELAHGSVA
jgi:hypothetical protein